MSSKKFKKYSYFYNINQYLLCKNQFIPNISTTSLVIKTVFSKWTAKELSVEIVQPSSSIEYLSEPFVIISSKAKTILGSRIISLFGW